MERHQDNGSTEVMKIITIIHQDNGSSLPELETRNEIYNGADIATDS